MKRGDHPRSQTILVMVVFAIAVLAALAMQYARMRARQVPSATSSTLPRR
jgi:hypothetical protein